MTNGAVSKPQEVLDVWRWIVEEEDHGLRLDLYLAAQEVGPTRSQLKKMIETGLALVDGEPSRPAKKLQAGQTVELRIPPPQPSSALPQEMDLDIRHEDNSLVVVNKPPGLVVHPAPGHPDGTLVNGLLFACSTSGGDPLRPGIVHRLDKDTSGLMVVAKNERVHAHLAAQFSEHSVDRRYLVLVTGDPPAAGQWDTLIGRRDGDRKKFSTRVRQGKRAISSFKTIERFPGAAALNVTLQTGRTHQVRVHCSDHGFPVLGDPWYGPKRMTEALRQIHNALHGQALHAEILGFEHPDGGQRLSFRSDPPPPFLDALAALRTSEAGSVE